jgi:outer membrane protein assembly factor BamD (BamD/ComL family)
VRLAAIELLGNDSQTVLKQIIEKYPESNFSQAAEKRLQSLVIDQASLLSRLFKS